MSKFIRYLDSIFIGAALLLAAGWNISPVDNDDFWLHVKTGELICRGKAIPDHDIFLNNPNPNPWVIHSWLSSAAFYQLTHRWGVDAVIAVKAGAVVLALALLFALFRSVSGSGFAGAAASLSVLFMNAGRIRMCRPMAFSYLLFAGLALTLTLYREGGRRRLFYTLPAAFFLWANLHGEFLMGIAMTALYAAGLFLDEKLCRGGRDQSWRTAAWLSACCFAATLCNPYFCGIYTHIFSFLHSPLYMGRNAEWAPVNVRHSWQFLLVCAAAAAAGILAFSRMRLAFLVPFAGLVALALYKNRLIYFASVSAALVLVSAYPVMRERLRKRSGRFFGWLSAGLRLLAIAAVLLVTQAAYARGMLFRWGVVERTFPEGGVRFMLDCRPQGKMVNFREWGGYLIYRLWPGYKVFIDGRVPEAAGETTWAYEAIAEAKPGFDSYLDRQGIDIVFADYMVFRRAADDPIQPIAFLKNWALVYWDDTAQVYLRDTPANHPLIEKYAYRAVMPSSVTNPFCTQDIDAAIAECRRSVETTPSERGYLFWGFLLMQQGRRDEAIGKFGEALKVNPGSAKALYNIGVVHMKQGMLDDAERYVSAALAMDRRYALARRTLEKIRNRKLDRGYLGNPADGSRR